MFGLDDLGQVAEDLRKRGINAWHDFLYGPYGCIEGLDVGDDFFPLWELKQAENEAALIRGDFAAILQRRSAEWTLTGPARVRRAAV